MSLIDNMMDKCILLDKVRTPDGEGGYYTEWKEGADIDVAITLDTTMQARTAEKEGVTSLYTLTTKKNVPLNFHDVIKRKKDGAIFRVTSNANEKVSPMVSSLDMHQVNGERWELTND